MKKKILLTLLCVFLISIVALRLALAEDMSTSQNNTVSSTTTSETLTDSSNTSDVNSDTMSDIESVYNESAATESGDLLIASNPNASPTSTETHNIYNPVSIAIAVIIVVFVAYLIIRYLNKSDNKRS